MQINFLSNKLLKEKRDDEWGKWEASLMNRQKN